MGRDDGAAPVGSTRLMSVTAASGFAASGVQRRHPTVGTGPCRRSLRRTLCRRGLVDDEPRPSSPGHRLQEAPRRRGAAGGGDQRGCCERRDRRRRDRSCRAHGRRGRYGSGSAPGRGGRAVDRCNRHSAADGSCPPRSARRMCDPRCRAAASAPLPQSSRPTAHPSRRWFSVTASRSAGWRRAQG